MVDLYKVGWRYKLLDKFTVERQLVNKKTGKLVKFKRLRGRINDLFEFIAEVETKAIEQSIPDRAALTRQNTVLMGKIWDLKTRNGNLVTTIVYLVVALALSILVDFILIFKP